MSDLFESEGDAVILHGGVCRCGHVFFPFQRLGCERCGAFGEDIRPVALAARGDLLASAKVLLKGASDLPTPYSIGAVRLEGGPIIRALLAVEAPSAPHPVEAHLFPNDSGGEPRHALRFSWPISE